LYVSPVLGAAPAGAQAPAAAHVDINDHGIFLIYSGGKNIGTEKFEIRAGAKQVEAQAEIHLRVEEKGKSLDLRTLPNLILDPQMQPLTYDWSQKGPHSSEVSIDFRSSPVRTHYKTVNGGDDKRDFQLAKDVVVLDDNVIHHYQLLVDRYASTAGGKQTFNAFVPQEALPGVITVEPLGPEPVTVEGTTVSLRHLILSTELARIDLWVDDQSRLQMVSVPEAQFQAVRKK
jgi:hypothetical protein